MTDCPFCNEPMPEDFLRALLAKQQAQWDSEHKPKHEARKPHPLTMAGRGLP